MKAMIMGTLAALALSAGPVFAGDVKTGNTELKLDAEGAEENRLEQQKKEAAKAIDAARPMEPAAPVSAREIRMQTVMGPASGDREESRREDR